MADKPNKNRIDDLLASKKKHEESLDSAMLTNAILSCEQKALSEAITLLESTKLEHQEKAQQILTNCLPHSGNSIRIGITGVPGVGKSTFIESFGTYLVNSGKKVAVLAIDPSSEKSGGSILGDKTRMTTLSSNKNAFIRPTATKGSLGGVARHTRESILLCEAAGFDVILVETVGVGQSETAVHSMTDFFLLLMLSGAGDELQGIKRGIMEMADSILITKADRENVKQSNLARSQYKSALHLFPPTENEWYPQVETVSSLENRGMDRAWEIIDEYHRKTKLNGFFEKNRIDQQFYWMKETLNDKILNTFHQSPGIKEAIEEFKAKIKNGSMTSYQAAEQIFKRYQNAK